VTDTVPRATRHRIMAAVPQANSVPEVAVRRIVHTLGFRFRLHDKRLPGSPDIVLPRLRKVIFVHGCFSHIRRKLIIPNREPAACGLGNSVSEGASAVDAAPKFR
jgi:DNA mismatch endonuclease Vsr